VNNRKDRARENVQKGLLIAGMLLCMSLAGVLLGELDGYQQVLSLLPEPIQHLVVTSLLLAVVLAFGLASALWHVYKLREKIADQKKVVSLLALDAWGLELKSEQEISDQIPEDDQSTQNE
jgi:hypothetical protein